MMIGFDQETSPFAQKRSDDYFFAAMATVIAATVFLGFAKSYFLAGTVLASLPTRLIHFHAVIFSLWILLFIAQVALVSTQRITWHKRLGFLGLGLAGLMFLVGAATLIQTVRRQVKFDIGLDTIFAGDTLFLTVFAVLIGWGFAARKDGAAHKRLMLLASAAILGPAVSRWPFDFGIVVFLLICDIVPILLIAFDLWSLRKIHRSTAIGMALIAAMQLALLPLGHSAMWHRITVWVQNF
jgi:hypothetical protein